MNSSDYFFHLTPDVIIAALEKDGYSLTGHTMALNSYENRVFDLKQENGSHLVAKFYRPGRWTREAIGEEHRFLAELRENEIPVCAPLEFSDGDTIHETGGIFYAVWPRTGGRSADELTDGELGVLGRLLGRIHNVGDSKKAPARRALTGETYGLEPLAYLLEKGFLPDHLAGRFSAAVTAIAEIYGGLAESVPVHRIHGDCHLGNLLFGGEGWFFLDFDDFCTGPAVQDIWMLTPARDAEGLRQRQILIDAYRTFRDFDESWCALIEPLRSLRYIHYAAWIARRWDDPAFPLAFPHFGSDAYWEEETRDLENQVEHIHDTVENIPGRLAHRREDVADEELSNRDFFWDWEE